MSLYTLTPVDPEVAVQAPERVTVRQAGTDRTVAVVEEVDGTVQVRVPPGVTVVYEPEVQP